MEAYKSKFSEALTPGEEGERAAAKEARLHPKALTLTNDLYKAFNRVWDSIEKDVETLYDQYKNNGATEQTLRQIEDMDTIVMHYHPDFDEKLDEFRGDLSEFYGYLTKFKDENPNLKMTRIGENKGK